MIYSVIFLAVSYPRSPETAVVLTDWLSIIAALGSFSRSSCSRIASRSAALSCSHTPVLRYSRK